MRRALFVVFIFSLVSPAFADTLLLKSGQKIEGKIVDQNTDSVKVNVSGAAVTYYRDEIENINGNSLTPAANVLEEDKNNLNAPANISGQDPLKEKVLKYFAYKDFIDLASGETSRQFLKKTQSMGPTGSDPNFFFSGAMTIQETYAALMRSLEIPDIPEVKKYHADRMKAVAMMIQSFQSGLNQNQTEFQRLGEQAKEMLQTTDQDEENIKSAYGVTDKEIDDFWASGKIDPAFIKQGGEIIKTPPNF